MKNSGSRAGRAALVLLLLMTLAHLVSKSVHRFFSDALVWLLLPYGLAAAAVLIYLIITRRSNRSRNR